jgi:hypothetical protein
MNVPHRLARVDQQQRPLTWSDLVAGEPRLADFLAEIQRIRDDGRGPGFCANEIWYGYPSLVGRLCDLVGWFRPQQDALSTSEGWDLACETLYGALPDCRNCSCIFVPGR